MIKNNKFIEFIQHCINWESMNSKSLHVLKLKTKYTHTQSDVYYLIVPQSVIVQKLLKTHEWAALLHWVTWSFITWTHTDLADFLSV